MSYTGAYDDGYRQCGCFWGETPGSLVTLLCERRDDWRGSRVLDAGCGEGKNAVFLAKKGAIVQAIDVYEIAIENGRRHWGGVSGVEFLTADLMLFPLPPNSFDLIIAYGLLHCLPTRKVIIETIRAFQASTKPGGYNIICTFNDRSHDLSAHPGFTPTLLRHGEYKGSYADWDILHISDSDLHETHSHNNIPHWHSLTRILAQKPAI
jgi:tellurite methyltransferase